MQQASLCIHLHSSCSFVLHCLTAFHLLQRVSAAEVQLDFLRQQPAPRSQFAETPSILHSVAVNNAMPLQVIMRNTTSMMNNS
jgi:hypothetical protein